MGFSPLPANTSEVLTIQTEMENRFVLEQLWSYGFPHQTVWLGMFFNTDGKHMLPQVSSLQNKQLSGLAYNINQQLAKDRQCKCYGQNWDKTQLNRVRNIMNFTFFKWYFDTIY